jgi:hypothetical protein
MRSWEEHDFVQNSKFWKDWPLARFLRNPPPKVPESWKFSPDDPLFSGRTGDYFRRLANFSPSRSDSSNVYRAVYGISQSKRGFAQVPPSFVAGSLLKHSQQLSFPPQTTLAVDGFNPVLARRFIQTILKGFVFPDSFLEMVRMEASTSASVYTARVLGGTRSSLREEASRLFSTGAPSAPDPQETISLSAAALPHHDEPNLFIGMREVAPGQVLEDRGSLPLTETQWRALVRHWETENPTYDRLPTFIQDSLTRKWEDVDRRSQYSFWSPPNLRKQSFARVAAVLEPLKVRTITAMDPVRAHASRPLQKSLWSHLRTFAPFALIGESISESLLHDFNTRHRKLALRLGISLDGDFVSGDYSAATDGLDIRLSKLFLESLLELLPEEDLVLLPTLRAALLEQVIVYPKGGPPPVSQHNGQLMGSVLSFPFLCLANLFAYMDSLGNDDFEQTYRLMSDQRLMRRLPVMINGDDILFRTDDLHYQRWTRSITKVGFRPSVGKNFRHKRFLTVNSVPIEFVPAPKTSSEFWADMSWADMFDLEMANPGYPKSLPDSLTDSFAILGFLNVGLLTGQSKLTGRDSLKSLPLSGWHFQSVLTAINPRQAHNWFLHYHIKEIKRQTQFGGTTLNLFAHPLKGGLGFVVPPGVEPRFSPEQRRIAQALFLSSSTTYEGQESQFDLPSLVSVRTPSAGTTLLASRRRRVEIELYPVNTPLTEGREVFLDTTQVSRLPLTTSYCLLAGDDDASQVECRLSGRQIRSLTKRFGTHTVELHPLDEMTSFPFVLVRVDRTVEGQAIYSPEIFLEDVPTSDVFEETFQPIEADSQSASVGGSIPPPSTPVPSPPPQVLHDGFGPEPNSIADWDLDLYELRVPSSIAGHDIESVVLEAPGDPTFINRGQSGRKRRRMEGSVPNAFRPSSYQY